MKIENTKVYGFSPAISAMRNPMDSWKLSDSEHGNFSKYNTLSRNFNLEGFVLGANDEKLSRKLVASGTEHCKHLRMIQVWANMTLPRYIWQEFDTYQHMVKISCSTMHKLMSYDLTPEMFEGNIESISPAYLEDTRANIVRYRNATAPDMKRKFKLIVKQLLPESFLQMRSINANYQTLLNIYNQRKTHELPEWTEICKWILSLPYFLELTGGTIYE